jgi:hypothetical protein
MNVAVAPRRRLFSVLASRDLRYVASGHAHQARRLQADGIEHVWTLSTAYCFPDAMQERIGEKIVGVVTVELTEAGHRVETVTPRASCATTSSTTRDPTGAWPGARLAAPVSGEGPPSRSGTGRVAAREVPTGSSATPNSTQLDAGARGSQP